MKFNISNILILFIWIGWLSLSVDLIFKEKIDESMLLVKKGYSSSARCRTSSTYLGIMFKVKYLDDKKSYTDVVEVYCSNEKIEMFNNASVVKKTYDDKIISLSVNGKYLLDVESGLKKYNSHSLIYSTFFMCLFLTVINIFRKRN